MESAKECVTTHLPKQPALKMDGALASRLYSAAAAELAGPLWSRPSPYAAVSRGVRG